MIYSYFLYILIFLFICKTFFSDNNLENIIYLSFISILCTVQYLLFNAADVSITEASIGASFSSILSLKFLSQYQDRANIGKTTNYNSLIKKIELCCYISFCLYFSYLIFNNKLFENDLYNFSDLNKRLYNISVFDYINKTKIEIGIKNIVTAVLAFFRGYDTLIETLVILTAGISVLNTLYDISKIENKYEIKLEEISKIQILYRFTVFFLPFIVIFAFYILFHGEESPGGGFQFGVIMASAFILYSLVISEDYILKLFSIKNLLRLSAFGCLIYMIVGIYPLLKGTSDSFLNYDLLLCADDISNKLCISKSRKIGIILVELGVGIAVFAVSLSLFLNLRLKSK